MDYHKTVENYLKAKKRFFDELPAEAFALTNADDKNGFVMLQNTKARKYSYATRTMADFKGQIIEESFEGMLLTINNHEISVPFIGRFNASNLLAVAGAAILLGIPETEALQQLSALHPVSGRFESLRSSKGYTAIVDYAHTPDALNNVLTTINEIVKGKNDVITVVGCGGNRDKGKRPLMAREAVEASTKVIITSDNPRDEEPMDIINDMLAGLDANEKQRTLTLVDREQAIRTACMMAKPGDVILVAGKGHENYQIIKGVKHHFDDKEVLQAHFAAE
jgi:UDP-N-acetylmuramoyl-L-alanyl-D-glutamate--2,6-diaminopimelate ligase